MENHKKPVLDWQPEGPTWSEFKGMKGSLQSLDVFVYPLNKLNTRHYANPVTCDGDLWIAQVKTSNGHLIGSSKVRHVNIVDAQLEAEEIARKHLAADWAALNPSGFLEQLLAHGADWAYGSRGNPFARIPGVVMVPLSSEELEKFGTLFYKAETLRLSQLVCDCGVGRIVKHTSGALRYSCACVGGEMENPSEWEPLKSE